jgi:hypothetical protein
MFGKSVIRFLSPQLNAQADCIDFQIMQNCIIEQMADRMDISALQRRPRQEVHPIRRHSTINVWGPRFIIRRTGNQKFKSICRKYFWFLQNGGKQNLLEF